MPQALATLPELLKVLGDLTRLRILGLLALEELSVGELSRCMGMTQSRVSNHLRLLREQRLLVERHVGASTFLRSALELDRTAIDPENGSGGQNGNGNEAGSFAERLWSTLGHELPTLPEHAADLERLRQVLAERRAGGAEFFDRMAGEWDKIGVDFASGQARQRAAASLLPAGLVIADLGCGTGYISRALLGLCSRLICVDHSKGMLEEAQKRLAPVPPGTHVELRQGSLDALPIADGELDGAICGMVLHHLADPTLAIAEMRRVVKPGGTAVVLELAPHRETWMREALGDRHLGLDASDVLSAFERAGFEDVRLEPLDDRYCPTPSEETTRPTAAVGLALYIVRGRIPAAT